jgi:hypothetical protein
MCIENWIPTLTSTSILGIVLFCSKDLIINKITQSVKHEYDSKLAELNARLENEKKERQSIRDFVFNNLQKRQDLLYEKQLKAVDSIWKVICHLSQWEFLCEIMCRFKLDKVSDNIENDPKYQEAFKIISELDNTLPKSSINISTNDLRPYLSELLYSYYEAYATIISHYVLLCKLFTNGLTDKFSDTEKMKKLILSVLPHKEKFIEKHGVNSSGFLLEELKEKILYEIKLFLDGKSSSNEDIQKINEIKKSIKDIDDSNQKIEEKLKSNSKQST